MKIIVFILLFLTSPGLCLAAPKLISPQRVYDLIREGSGLWMIDVRSSALYDRSHIEGSINIPLLDLPNKRLPENKILILVDNSLGQQRAKQAAELLPDKISKIFLLTGGVRGWQREGLPLVGSGDFFELARVFPNELSVAQRSGVTLKLFDLRTAAERKLAPLGAAATVPAGTFDTRLKVVLKQLQQSTAQGIEALNSPIPMLLVLPTGVSAAALYRTRLWNLPGDVRVLEGAYLNGAESETRTVNSGGCMTCPGDRGLTPEGGPHSLENPKINLK